MAQLMDAGWRWVFFMLLLTVGHTFPFVGVEWLHFEALSDTAIVSVKLAVTVAAVLFLFGGGPRG